MTKPPSVEMDTKKIAHPLSKKKDLTIAIIARACGSHLATSARQECASRSHLASPSHAWRRQVTPGVVKRRQVTPGVAKRRQVTPGVAKSRLASPSHAWRRQVTPCVAKSHLAPPSSR